jgi:hypothetical protein
MTMTIAKTEHSTTDLNEAAFILAAGHRLLRVDDGPFRSFVFVADAVRAADAYHRDAPVPARSFVRHLREVRNFIHGR